MNGTAKVTTELGNHARGSVEVVVSKAAPYLGATRGVHESEKNT